MRDNIGTIIGLVKALKYLDENENEKQNKN